MTEQQHSLLGGYRVLDLTDEVGLYCGRLLADMGAAVIKVEKPGGDAARNIGPFYHDTPDPEKSLFWYFMCMNKRGITLDIETPDGREIFKKLAKGADFVIESFIPGHMSHLGLGYTDLEMINRRIIMVSITPFGQKGPYANYKASDLTTWAMAGPMNLSGDPDRPPVQVSFPQAFLHAGANAAVGALIANYHCQMSGEGQHVDVSAQEASSFVSMEAPAFWELLKFDVQRSGPGRDALFPKGRVRIQFVYPCKDGHVFYLAPGAAVMITANRAWTEWLTSEGVSVEHLKGMGWPDLDFMNLSPQDFDMIQGTLGDFMITRTKADLYEEALKRDIPLVPVSTSEDVLENPQLRERGYWIEVEHPDLGVSLTYPGPWAKVTEAPLTGWRPAPLIGEHNEDIYGKELGFSRKQMVILKQAGVI